MQLFYDKSCTFEMLKMNQTLKIKNMKKNSEITEDDMKNLEKDVQKLTDKFCDNIDGLINDKEKEIMAI